MSKLQGRIARTHYTKVESGQSGIRNWRFAASYLCSANGFPCLPTYSVRE